MIPKRIVLDTNICLDLFVFRDPRWSDLRTALSAGTVEAVTRPDCRREWLHVLNYPHLPLDDASRARAIDEFDAQVTCADYPAVPQAPAAPRLPVCKDTDDQKFLELARDAGAQALITKDKALLKLARRAGRDGFFLILTPEKWTAVLERDDRKNSTPLAGGDLAETTAEAQAEVEPEAAKRLQ
jgi:predicted nucleic acid-binding protein